MNTTVWILSLKTSLFSNTITNWMSIRVTIPDSELRCCWLNDGCPDTYQEINNLEYSCLVKLFQQCLDTLAAMTWCQIWLRKLIFNSNVNTLSYMEKIKQYVLLSQQHGRFTEFQKTYFFPRHCRNNNWNMLSKIKIFVEKGLLKGLHKDMYYCFMDDVFHYLPPTVPLLHLRNRACHQISYTIFAKKTDIETSTAGASCILPHTSILMTNTYCWAWGIILQSITQNTTEETF